MRFETPHAQPDKFEKIGEGTQKKTYMHAEDSDAVTLHFKSEWTAEEVKALFYIQKIAHILFPEETISIRQVGQSANTEGRVESFARTEYVSPEADPIHTRMQELYEPAEGLYDKINKKDQKELDEYYRQSRNDKRVRAFLYKYRAAGLENRLAQLGRQDRIELGDGQFKYVDVSVPWDMWDDENGRSYKELLFDPDKLLAAISNLPAEEQKKAHVYYDRLLDLCRQVGFDV